MEEISLSTEVEAAEEKVILPYEGKGFVVRAGAYIIDGIIYIVTTYATAFVMGIVIAVALVITGQDFFFDEEAMRIPNYIVSALNFVLYFAIFEWLYGAPLGKVILGMRVVMEDGRSCTFGAAILRGIIRFIDGLLFGLVAYVNMEPPHNQRWGDKKAKTIVVSATDPAIQNKRSWPLFLLALLLYLTLNSILVFMVLMIGTQIVQP